MRKMSGEISKTEKYAKPKIALFDIQENISQKLIERGNNILIASLGNPYKVEKASNYSPVFMNSIFPENFIESEVIVFDFQVNNILNTHNGRLPYPIDDLNFWSKRSLGFIDPRPISAFLIQKSFQKIYNNKGITIIFASPDVQTDFSYGKGNNSGNFFNEKDLTLSIWNILPILRYVNVKKESGLEIKLLNNKGMMLSDLLSRYLNDAEFFCHFDIEYEIQQRWLPLLSNKFNEPISGIIFPEKDCNGGLIFIFPHIRDKGDFLCEFINDFLPTISPEIFPYHKSSKWISHDEYKLPKVRELEKEINEIKIKCQEKIDEIDQKIEQETEKNKYLQSLLTETGDELVNSVIRTLKLLGFNKIINCDEKKGVDENNNLREDIQINDKSPLILIEVKGISNLPAEADSLQVQKYLAPRMKELKRTDIIGVFIVNHQRNIPPLSRENNKVFQDDIIINATQHGLGLLTTWDLYRLTRNYLKLKWDQENIKKIFYKNGRITPIPSNFKYIGNIEKIWPEKNVMGLIPQNEQIKIGDTLLFELEIEFMSGKILSIQSDDKEIQIADINSKVGVNLDISIQDLKINTLVYVDINDDSSNSKK